MIEEFVFEVGIFVVGVAGVAIKWWMGKDDARPDDIMSKVNTLEGDVKSTRETMQRMYGKILEMEGRQKVIGEQIRDQHMEILATASIIDGAASDEE